VRNRVLSGGKGKPAASKRVGKEGRNQHRKGGGLRRHKQSGLGRKVGANDGSEEVSPSKTLSIAGSNDRARFKKPPDIYQTASVEDPTWRHLQTPRDFKKGEQGQRGIKVENKERSVRVWGGINV